MERKSKFSIEEKLQYVLRCLEGRDSIRHTAGLIGISKETLREWIMNYQSLGIDGLSNSSKNSSYSAQLKEMAVEDYLTGAGSHMEICKKYGVKSTHQLRSWILKYNNHEKLKTSGTGGTAIMTKGRKTTFDERIEIVTY